jgi:transcriptional regulator with XRE-family HTH domain
MESHMTLTIALKKAITDSSVSLYRIAKDSGVDASTLSRFMSGERDLQLSTADKLAAFFSLEVAQRTKPARKRRPK